MPPSAPPRSARSRALAIFTLGLGLGALAVTAPACSSSSSATTGGGTCEGGTGTVACASPGKVTPGPSDAHCGKTVQPTDPSVCNQGAPGTGGSAGAAGGGGKGGAAGKSGVGGSGGSVSCPGASAGYGCTMYGQEGDDDDCKYHVKWTSTPLCEAQGDKGVTFTVVATHKTDGSPLAGADPYAEVYQDNHPAPNPPAGCAQPTAVEGPPGTYAIAPVLFDASGEWTVRFHFDHTCTDFSPRSPHGHAAFFVTVP